MPTCSIICTLHFASKRGLEVASARAMIEILFVRGQKTYSMRAMLDACTLRAPSCSGNVEWWSKSWWGRDRCLLAWLAHGPLHDDDGDLPWVPKILVSYKKKLTFHNTNVYFLTISHWLSWPLCLPSFGQCSVLREWILEVREVKWKSGSLISRSEKWNENLVHSFRPWKVKWKCLDIESEKWNENVSKSRSRVKSELKMPRDRDQEVNFLENFREILEN